MKPVLACRPMVMSDLEREVAAEAGLPDMSIPYPGSVEQECTDCGRGIWVGPQQQHKQRQGATAMCFHCAVAAAAAAREVTVQNLGSVHPDD